MKVMIGYKAFSKDLKCRDFQFKIGESYTHKGDVKLCGSGFHFCEEPFDVLNYYDLVTSRFAKVEATGVSKDTSGDSKRVAKKITVKSELKLDGLIKAQVKFVFSKVDFKNAKESNDKHRSAATNTGYRSAATNTGYRSAATNTGDQSAATNTGDQSAATNTGYRSAATNTGDQSAATNTGDQSAATNTGYRSAATNTGDQSAATNTGDQSAATNTGYRSAATNTGYRSAATNTGYQSAATAGGKESQAINTGVEGRASGKKGCWLTLTEWENPTGKYQDWHIKEVKSVKVDGKAIKANTFYTLQDGEFVEVK